MKAALVVLLALAVAACGFHPRSRTMLPTKLGATRVEVANAYSPIGDELAGALERSGVPAGAATDPASSVLRIGKEVWSTQPLAVDQFAQVREYVTRYRVEFALQGPDGKPMLDPQAIELSREYSFDANAAAGSPAEQSLIEKELRRDMAAAILRRVDYALRARP